jgi:GNAT superfamily N-acetyltransferase
MTPPRKDDRPMRFLRIEGRESDATAAALGAEIALRFGPRDEKVLSIVAHEDDGALLCGLNGVVHWRWLYVRHFYVAPGRRGGGVGRDLMLEAERMAREKNALGVYLDTFDEAAARFYERLGFARHGRIENFPPGAARIFLSKTL